MSLGEIKRSSEAMSLGEIKRSSAAASYASPGLKPCLCGDIFRVRSHVSVGVSKSKDASMARREESHLNTSQRVKCPRNISRQIQFNTPEQIKQ